MFRHAARCSSVVAFGKMPHRIRHWLRDLSVKMIRMRWLVNANDFFTGSASFLRNGRSRMWDSVRQSAVQPLDLVCSQHLGAGCRLLSCLEEYSNAFDLRTSGYLLFVGVAVHQRRLLPISQISLSTAALSLQHRSSSASIPPS